MELEVIEEPDEIPVASSSISARPQTVRNRRPRRFRRREEPDPNAPAGQDVNASQAQYSGNKFWSSIERFVDSVEIFEMSRKEKMLLFGAFGGLLVTFLY